MDKFCLILALVGFSNGFQAPLEYQYRYMSSIGSGIPELSDQSSGVALRGDVTVQVHEDGTLRFQFADVEVAQFNNERGCDIEGDIPKQFAPMPDAQMQNSIEQPFEVHLGTSDDISLVVEKDELPWITNTRKAIVGVAKNEFMIGNFKFVNGSANHVIADAMHNGHLPKSFSVMEDSIFGICLIEYTISKLPIHLQNHENHDLEIEDDIQRESGPVRLISKTKTSKKSPPRKASKKYRSKTSKTRPLTKKHPDIKNDLWHVTKTINFDNCEDTAFGAQYSPLGVDGELDGDQYKWLRARSSVAEITLRGSPGAFRIESATVEGATWMSPFGLDTESLQVRSTQTYKLVAVREAKREIKLPAKLKNLHPWSMQYVSSIPSPIVNRPMPWITYGANVTKFGQEGFGAKHLSNGELKKIQDLVTDFIKEAALDLTDLDQKRNAPIGQVSDFLFGATDYMKMIDKHHLRAIFDDFYGHSTHANEVLNSLLTVDAMVASGTLDAISTVIDIIKEEKLPYYQIFTIAMTLTTSVETPAAIPQIMDYVMHIDLKEKPFLGGTLLLNFANLVHHLCIDPDAPTVTYLGKMHSDYTCDLDAIKSTFVPYLKGILENTSGERNIWEKEIALKAIGNLGSPFSIPVVRDIIFGKSLCKKELAITAIYILSGPKIGKHSSSHAREEILSMMNEVFSNLGEDALIRQAALVVMVSWGPNLSFWHRLARMSWKEPSKQLSVYISSMIESVANMKDWKYIKDAQAAGSAKSFSKPFAPSQKYSQIYMHSLRAAEDHVSKLVMFEWIKDVKAPKAIDAYLLMMMNVGGFEMVDFEAYINIDTYAGGYIKKLESMISSTDSSTQIKSNIAAQIANDLFSKIKDTVNFKSPEDSLNQAFGSSANIYARAFQHIQFFLPVNYETIKKPPFLRKFFEGNQNHLAQLAVQLSMGYDLTIAKYFCPIYMYSFLSTDVGLPLFATVNVPIVISEDSLTTVTANANGMDVKAALESSSMKVEDLLKLYTQSTSGMYVIAPWTESLYSVEVKSNREITLPIILTARVNVHEEKNKKTAALHCDLESYYHNKFSVLRANTQSQTAVYPYVLLERLQSIDIKPIQSSSPVKEVHNEFPQIYTGLQFDFTWRSSIPLSYVIEKFYDHIVDEDLAEIPFLLYALGSPTLKGWYFELNFDPKLSKTKNASIGITIEHFQEEKPKVTDYGQQTGFEQYGQETGDYEQYGQNPFSQDQEPDSEVEITGQIAYEDNDKKRFEKLKSKYGSSLWTCSLTADFVGDEDRSYEILMTRGAPQKSNNKKLLKAELAFFRGPIPGKDDKPLSFCLDLKKSAPFFTPLDSIQTLRESNLDTQVEANLYMECKGQPELTVKGHGRITAASGEILINEVRNSCDYDQYDEMNTVREYGTYDHITYDVKWKHDVCEMGGYLKMMANEIFVPTLEFLQLDNNKCAKQDLKKEVHATLKRCPYSHHWSVNLERDGKEFDYEDPELDSAFDEIFHIDHHSEDGYESHKCSVGTSHVRTFDGYNYDYTPTKCWTVAYKDCLHDRGAVLLVRSPEGESSLPEVRYISKYQQFVIDIEHNRVRVNGREVTVVGSETVTDDDGDHIATITSTNGHFLIKIKPHYYFLIKDVVQIHVPEDSMTTTCGLCGNYDGEPIGDLVGPQLCPYSEVDDFVASWSGASDTCDTYAIFGLRKNVDDIQKKCHSSGHDNPSWKHTCSDENYDNYGTQYNWRIIGDSTQACISESPVPFCQSGCSSFDVHQKTVIYQCWPKNIAPAELVEAVESNQNHLQKKLQILEHHKQYRQELLPTACKCF